MEWWDDKEGIMTHKTLIFITVCLAVYTVTAWIIAFKVIVDFLFMLGMWAVQ